MNSSTLMDSLDNYLCAVNYPLLAEELKDLISLDDFMLEVSINFAQYGPVSTLSTVGWLF